MQMKEARQPDSQTSVFSDLRHNTSKIPAAFTIQTVAVPWMNPGKDASVVAVAVAVAL